MYTTHGVVNGSVLAEAVGNRSRGCAGGLTCPDAVAWRITDGLGRFRLRRCFATNRALCGPLDRWRIIRLDRRIRYVVAGGRGKHYCGFFFAHERRLDQNNVNAEGREK